MLAIYRNINEDIEATEPKSKRLAFAWMALKYGIMGETTWLRWCDELEAFVKTTMEVADDLDMV